MLLSQARNKREQIHSLEPLICTCSHLVPVLGQNPSLVPEKQEWRLYGRKTCTSKDGAALEQESVVAGHGSSRQSGTGQAHPTVAPPLLPSLGYASMVPPFQEGGSQPG